MNEDTLLSINKVAEMLGVTLQTLRNWDKKGVLKAIQITTRSPRKYVKEDIEQFIERQRT